MNAWNMGCFEEVSTAGAEPACLSPFECKPVKDAWMRMNLDSGCAMTTFPRAYGAGKGGNFSVYKTASGEFIKDEGGVSDAKAEDTRSTTHGWNRTECDAPVMVHTWFEAFQCSIVA